PGMCSPLAQNVPFGMLRPSESRFMVKLLLHSVLSSAWRFAPRPRRRCHRAHRSPVIGVTRWVAGDADLGSVCWEESRHALAVVKQRRGEHPRFDLAAAIAGEFSR